MRSPSANGTGHVARGVPSGAKTTICRFVGSATSTSPFAATATPMGPPSTSWPKLPRTRPSGAKRTTRRWPVSVT